MHFLAMESCFWHFAVGLLEGTRGFLFRCLFGFSSIFWAIFLHILAFCPSFGLLQHILAFVTIFLGYSCVSFCILVLD